MSNAQKYIAESLGSCGFAVLRGQIAYTQRPDLWATGSDASYDFQDKQLNNRLGTVIGCKTYLARFEGIDGPLIKVLARSEDQLAQRLEWVTGFRPKLLIHESEMQGQRDESNIPPRKNLSMGASTEGGDLYQDLVTAEPGRRCTECEWSRGRGCGNSDESGINWPALNAPRRCIAFRPVFSSNDGRLGTVLWPELAALKTK